MPTIRESILEAQQSPDFTPPTQAQSDFADKVVLLTGDWSYESAAKVLALAYAESLAAGRLRVHDLDIKAQFLVLLAINREETKKSLQI